MEMASSLSAWSKMIKRCVFQKQRAFCHSVLCAKVIDKHVPLKQNIISCNNAPFVNKELSKVIMNRLQIKIR